MLAFALCGVSVLAGCKSDGKPEVASTFASSSSDSATNSAPSGPPDLPTVSLGVADLPTGWVTSTDKTAILLGEIGCLKTAERRSATKLSHYVTFSGPGGAPVFSQSLAYFAPARIAADYDAAVKALDGCKTISIKAGPVTLVGPLSATSSPTIGAQSRLYTLVARSGTHALTEFVLISRSANVLMLTSYATVKNPSLSDFLALSGRGAAKLA